MRIMKIVDVDTSNTKIIIDNANIIKRKYLHLYN